jgi:hypothetical protein
MDKSHEQKLAHAARQAKHEKQKLLKYTRRQVWVPRDQLDSWDSTIARLKKRWAKEAQL